MAILSVRKYGDPALRRRASEIQEITPEIRALAADMIDTMYDEVGIGLAAPQVGVSLRLIVVADDEARQVRTLVNPAIVEQGGQVSAEEGCLSIPGVFAGVNRFQWVRVEGRDLDGRPVSVTARGLLARIFQHEHDHLDGTLFIDRLDAVARDRVKRRIRKQGFQEDTGHRAAAL
jgi:peptide deformylase